MDGLRAVKDGNQELIGYISGEEGEWFAYEPHEVSETGALTRGCRFTSLEEAQVWLLEVRQ